MSIRERVFTAAAVMSTWLFSAPLAAQTPATPAPPVPIVKEGKTVKLSKHVYLIPDERVPMVPNVGIIVGDQATLVIDAGMGKPSGEVVLREVRKVSRNKILYVVSTHFHPEHATGDIAFPADTRIVRAEAQQQDIDEMGMKWVENFRSRSAAIAGTLEGVTGFRPATEKFDREKTIDLGGVSVKLLRLGPGHTRGDTAIFVEGDKVLFSGDLAMKNLFPAFATPQSRSDTWLAALERLDELKPEIVVGAHYERADGMVISDYRKYLHGLRSRVEELKKKGVSAEEAAKELRAEFAAKYPDWQQPLRVHTAAMVIYNELK